MDLESRALPLEIFLCACHKSFQLTRVTSDCLGGATYIPQPSAHPRASAILNLAALIAHTENRENSYNSYARSNTTHPSGCVPVHGQESREGIRNSSQGLNTALHPSHTYSHSRVALGNNSPNTTTFNTNMETNSNNH